ncbi:MAG: TIGR04282 family arsenosugar biosynthesis glycosyltransferase [Anaerolineae bacterium]|nr:TIGR04282 family arsenosugar biosynthesis glycosyltransferase [Anaerolineae bacterium]
MDTNIPVSKNQVNSTILAIMAKEPKVGSTKTRLTPSLRSEEAAKLYEVLLWDTILMVSQIKEIDFAITVTPPESIDYFKRAAPTASRYIPVSCTKIGECLSFVLGQLLIEGYARVLALNSDGPTLPADYIRQAIQKLDHFDLVLGPAEDGGYYLIGYKEHHADLFEGISWSTSNVFVQTLVKSKNIGLKVWLLPPWYDIDTVKDLHRLRTDLESLPSDNLIHTREFLKRWPGIK